MATLTYRLSASHSGYERREVSVTVTNADPYAAQVVDFELAPDHSYEWSEENDFGLKANLKAEYLSNTELEAAMANLENEYPGFAEVFLNEADWSSVVPAIKLSSGDMADDNRANVALFGGVYGSQPLGREILLRLAR